MEFKITNTDGLTLHTANKYCEEDISIAVDIETKEDLTTELSAQDTSIGTQETTIDSIISALEGKAAGVDIDLKGLIEKTITSLTLPNDLTKIGAYAFYNCSNLVINGLPSGITSIGQYAFYTCPKVVISSLPSGLTSIEPYTFYNCSKLTCTELPNNITSIGSNALRKCYYLALTKLPDALTTLAEQAFNSCSRMTITSVPSGVTVLNEYVFAYCTGLTELTFQGAITNIAKYALYSCTGLTKLVFPNITAVPTLAATSAFGSSAVASGTCYIYVPDTLVDSMKAATNWSTYAAQIKGLSEL